MHRPHRFHLNRYSIPDPRSQIPDPRSQIPSTERILIVVDIIKLRQAQSKHLPRITHHTPTVPRSPGTTHHHEVADSLSVAPRLPIKAVVLFQIDPRQRRKQPKRQRLVPIR